MGMPAASSHSRVRCVCAGLPQHLLETGVPSVRCAVRSGLGPRAELSLASFTELLSDGGKNGLPPSPVWASLPSRGAHPDLVLLPFWTMFWDLGSLALIP